MKRRRRNEQVPMLDLNHIGAPGKRQFVSMNMNIASPMPKLSLE